MPLTIGTSTSISFNKFPQVFTLLLLLNCAKQKMLPFQHLLPTKWKPVILDHITERYSSQHFKQPRGKNIYILINNNNRETANFWRHIPRDHIDKIENLSNPYDWLDCNSIMVVIYIQSQSIAKKLRSFGTEDIQVRSLILNWWYLWFLWNKTDKIAQYETRKKYTGIRLQQFRKKKKEVPKLY